MAWRNLIEGHPMNISTKLFENRLNTFGEEDFLSFHYGHIRQNSPALWRPCFSTNQHFLKESNKGSPKEHFYKIIWKSAWHFQRRRFFKFSLFFSFGCHGNQNYGWIKKQEAQEGQYRSTAIRQNKISKQPCPLVAIFFNNHHGLKECFCKIIWKSAWHFRRRGYFKFSL